MLCPMEEIKFPSCRPYSILSLWRDFQSLWLMWVFYLVSDIPKEAPSTKKYDSSRELQDYKSDEQKKEMVRIC